MLDAFEIENFKSYRHAKLPLAPLTLLIGANASGKSNLLEAMQLLAWLARGRRLADLTVAIEAKEVSIRGRPVDLPLDPSNPLVLRCRIGTEHAHDDKGPVEIFPALDLAMGLRMDNGGPRVVTEELDAADSTTSVSFYYRVAHPAPPHGSEIDVEYNNFTRGGKKPQIRCVDQQAVFTQLLTPARFAHAVAQKRIPQACLWLRTRLFSTLFLDPNPKAMRGWAYADEHDLRGDGANVSSVLAYLCDAPEHKEQVLAFVRALPEQDITDIDFHHTERSEVMVKLAESFGGKLEWRDATVLSDGTLRVLAVAAAVLSAEPGSLVVIEEIDNGVHPSRAQLLLEALHRVATERGIHILLTTHNPALADATPKAAIPHVVACYRDPTTGFSELRRLSELDDYAALVAQGPLGFLMESGTLDRYLKRKRDVEEREREAQTVLQLFRKAGQ